MNSTESAPHARPLTAEDFRRPDVAVYDLLLARPHETPDDILRRPTAHRAAELICRAETAQNSLRSENPDIYGPWSRNASVFYEHYDRDGHDMVQVGGMYFNRYWMQDVAARIVQGHPVEVGFAPPHSRFIPGFTMNLNRQSAYNNELARNTAAIARVVRSVGKAVGGTTRSVFEMHDLAYDQRRKQYHADLQAAEEFLRELYRYDAFRPGDVPGRDFVGVSKGYSLRLRDDLLNRLQQSGNGDLIMPDETTNSISFRLKPWIARLTSSDITATRPPANYLTVPVTDTNGLLTPPAAEAVTYLSELNELYHHVLLRPRTFRTYREGEDTFMLLRAMNITSRDRFQTIIYRPDSMNEVAPYLARALYAELGTITERLRQSVPYTNMQVQEYAYRNYGGEQMLDEDRISIDVEMDCRDLIADCLGIDLSDPTTLLDSGEVVHPGHGPNLYPTMLTQPFTKEHAGIVGEEYTETGRQYMRSLKQGTLPPKDMQMWDKFAAHMVASPYGGPLYEDAVRKARQKLTIRYGNIFARPQGTVRLEHPDFVIESAVMFRSEFHEGLNQSAQAMASRDAVFVGRFVRRSPGWDGHDGTMVDLSDIRAAAEDVGLEVLVLVDVSQDVPGDKRFRPDVPDEGVAFMVARQRDDPRPLSEASRQTIAKYAHGLPAEFC
jgi:hypothetical protein